MTSDSTEKDVYSVSTLSNTTNSQDSNDRNDQSLVELEDIFRTRLRRQSDSEVWIRPSLRMDPKDYISQDISQDPSIKPSSETEPSTAQCRERHSFPSLRESDATCRTESESFPNQNQIQWCKQGKVSQRASEMLEDARLSLHGKEGQLYEASIRRLSTCKDPVLSTLCTSLAQSRAEIRNATAENSAHGQEAMENHFKEAAGRDAREATDNTGEATDNAGETIENVGETIANVGQAIVSDVARELTDLSHYIGSSSEPLQHEFVRWTGTLRRRSEWLRRTERHFYVLEGKCLRRYSSKEAFLTHSDEPYIQNNRSSQPTPNLIRQQSTPPQKDSVNNTSPTSLYHRYILAGVKDSSTRQNGFTFITEDKKTLQLNAANSVEKIIWMRLALEAIVALPNLPVTPLDMEEFYAMLVVLYTSYRGNWKTEGDMAVTLPPPSEQVFTRFFRLVHKDIIFCTNYPPSVPFHGAYRGHSGVVTFMHEFAKHTLWRNFKIGGLSVEKSIAVASGKEELENQADRRKFNQNWIHKFTFSENGKLTRFEINGDVVAASAVFKLPGAATTLKLPQDYNEVDAEHGKEGVLVVRIMQGSGIKLGSTLKRSPRCPRIRLMIAHAGKQQRLRSSTDAKLMLSSSIAGIPVPVSLTRKLHTGINLLQAAASNLPSYDSVFQPHSDTSCITDPPRNNDESRIDLRNPVWNQILLLPYSNVIGTCSLQIELVDQSRVKLGFDTIAQANVNIARYLMSIMELNTCEEEMAIGSNSRWVTLSNIKGEYCGKILIGICARKMQSQPQALFPSPSSTTSQHTLSSLEWRSSSTVHLQTPDANLRRHGWAHVRLSPNNSSPLIPSPLQTSPFNSLHSIICKENDSMHTFIVCGAPFTIPKHYQLIKVCGRGAYGIVIAATNTLTGGNVAIKKVIDCIWHPHQLKLILREVRLIRHMTHENILTLMDLIPPPSYSDFCDVYMTIDLMEMDLHRIIYSKEVLLDDHIRYFLYQILSGLYHMHKAGVLHRDLKPSNLLINSDCQLKICDFGLARTKDWDENGMTEYVVTRWYRAPELLLGSTYGEGVDLWAAGCIFAEMLGRKPLFPGETYVHQLTLIINVLGVPEEHSFTENPQANKLKGRQLLSQTHAVPGIDVSTLFPNANPEALDLLWKMLVFDAGKRISVKEALEHPYLSAYYDKEREELDVELFHYFDLDGLEEQELKELMFKEICYFHPEEMEKRASQQKENPETFENLPPGWVKRESRSVPGKFYYSHPKRGLSTWNRADVKE